MRKFPHMEVIRGKWNKVKIGLFTSWQGYSNIWRKHKILIISSYVQWNTTATLKNGLQDINRPNLYLRCASGNSLPRNFLTILGLLLPVSWIVTKFTFIGIILEDTIALHVKKIFFNICIYQLETDKSSRIMLKDTIALHGKK